MSEKKKKRFPILLKIASLVVLGQLLSSGIFLIVSNRSLLDHVAKDRSDEAFASGLALKTALGSREGLFRLAKDADFREKTHKTARFICRSMQLRYLYLYTLDEKNYRHYLLCAAANDEDDRKMNEDYGFGSVQKTKKLYSAEIAALSGETDRAYDIVNNEYGHVCSFILPIRNKDNSVAALMGVDFSIDNILGETRTQIRFVMFIDFLLFVLELFIALLLVKQSVIRPLLFTADRMKRFVADRNVSVTYKKRLFNDEITDIEESFQKMERDISDYLQKIEALSLEKAQTAAQLDVARKIQSGIVPEEMSLSGDGYDIYGCMRPALEVGGDFYDIFNITDKKICVVVGDISGKGIIAALFMNMVKTAIKARILAGMSLAGTLNDLNKEISISNPENMFATVFMAMLDCETGELSYANAGHNAPVLIKNDVSYLVPDPGIALGLFDDSDIREEKIALSSGEGLLIYTDGVTESINADKVQYGEERLAENVGGGNGSAKEMVLKVVNSVKSFAEGLPQFDDITCVSLVYRGNQDGERLAPDMASFAAVKNALLSSFGNTEKTRTMIMVCEEMFSNIVNYSGADSVSFSCENKEGVCSVTFTDNGKPFDPVHASLKVRDFEDLDNGGMGIQLARVNTKEMLYSGANGKNMLTLRFEI